MKIALVDGFNLTFRAYYGMPDLTREDGFPTGAMHGWVRQMWWIEDNVKADRIYVFFIKECLKARPYLFSIFEPEIKKHVHVSVEPGTCPLFLGLCHLNLI